MLLLKKYWPVGLAAAVLLPHAWLFNFVNDDAYISFRYARNLAEHGQLVFNLGERVEGFTNFLWTLLLAAAMKLGVEPALASRGLGAIFAVGTLAVTVRISLRLDEGRPHPAHAVAPLVLAATGAFACWVTGGLETQLITFLTLLSADLALVEADRGTGCASAATFALAGLTRPEGAFFFALGGLHRLTANLARRRRPVTWNDVRWAALFLGVFGPYFAWRWRYYGYLFPNTFYVKSAGGAGTWKLGLAYLRRFAEDHEILLLLPALALGFPPRTDRRRRDLFAFSAIFCLGFAVYVVKVGGDFMGLYRFILPALPLVALCAQEALRALGARLAPTTGRPALAASGLLAAAGYVAGSAHASREAVTFIGADGGIDTPGYLKRYADERIPVGRWFGRYARPDDLMTVGGAGVIPYYAGIRAYDVFGLVDAKIAHDPGMSVADRPGHEKWGSEPYMLSRKPTLITHIYRLREKYRPPPDEAAYWAARGFEWVTADIPELSPPYYSFLKRIDRAFGPLPARPRPPGSPAP